MTRNLAAVLTAVFLSAPAFGQGVLFFQDGVTDLGGGLTYGVDNNGIVDTEFRAANPTTPQGENPEISVDQFDGGFQTQGALRFENILQSDGGLLPDELDPSQILFAEFAIWKQSPSQSDANIDFQRVSRDDVTSGATWTEDDTWASLGGDLIPDINGLLDGDPINRVPGFNGGVLEVDAAVDFSDTGDRFAPDEQVELVPGSPVLSSDVYVVDSDSEDVFDDAWDGTEADLFRAIEVAKWRFDVTDAITAWFADTDAVTPGTQPAEVNRGWAIFNDTGDGWDMVASENTESFESEFDGLSPEELLTFRPSLTIIFDDGSLGPADIDKDGDVDPVDVGLFADLVGSHLDGPLPTGAPGDFDFDRDVDLDDFKAFQLEFLAQTGNPVTAAFEVIPEPTSCLLFALALCGLAGARGTKRG